MQFAVHAPGALRGIKIDWDVPVELGAEIREAMAPNDVDQMRVGILRRGFVVKIRSKVVTYPRGTLAFRVAEAHEVFLQLPVDAGDAPVAVTAEPGDPIAVWTVETSETGERHRVVVDAKRDGERTDVIIAGVVTTVSRATAQRLIDDGHVSMAGQPIKKANQRLRAGDVIEIVVARSSVE